jgi:SulP family sulfate permease
MIVSQQWLPRSIECLRGYTPRQLTHDLVAGLTVGLVALPLAMAFAIASGVPPQAGLYTAVVVGFLISALGGSRTQIGGPTGAFVVIVSGIVLQFGLPGLALVGMMAGVLLLVMGLTGLGAAVEFIPRPVTIGFTNGIALLIVSTPIKDFLGLTTPTIPGEFVPRIAMLVHYADTARWQTVGIAATSLAVILLWPRATKRRDVVILRLRNMTALDATGIHALEQLSERLRKTGRTLLLCGARDQPSRLISGSEFLQHVGAENVLPHVRAALARASEIQHPQVVLREG